MTQVRAAGAHGAGERTTPVPRGHWRNGALTVHNGHQRSHRSTRGPKQPKSTTEYRSLPTGYRATLGKTPERRPKGAVGVLAHGVVHVHSAPPAICPHVEWALSDVLGARVCLQWTEQPASPGQLRTSMTWTGAPGSGGRLATSLRKWQMLRFEVTEDATPGADGERICYLPGRGLWRAAISASGDVMLGESQITALMSRKEGYDDLCSRLAGALGVDVDAELEPYRRAGEGTVVTWLHQVG